MAVQIDGSQGSVIATSGSYSGGVSIGGTLTYEDVTNIDAVGLITARSGIEVGASPGVGASISADGNMIISGISTFKDILYVADKILHDGDGNTGMRFPAADTISFETGGTARARIDSSGKVGIATNNPARLLSLEAKANNDGILIHAGGDHYPIFEFDANRSGAGGNCGQFDFKWNGTGITRIATLTGADTTNKDDGVITFHTAAAGTLAEALRIDSSGRVLVGTTAGWGSDVKLHLGSSGNTYSVITSGTTHNGVLAFSDDGTARGAIDYDHNNDNMLFSTAATERLKIKSDGAVCIDNVTGTFTIGGDNVYNSSKVNLQVGSMTQTSDTTESTAIVIHDQNSKRNGTESAGNWVSGIRFMSTQINGGSRYGAFINHDIRYNNFSGGATKMRSDLVFATRGDAQTGTGDAPSEKMRMKHNGEILVKGQTKLTSSTTVNAGTTDDFRIGLKHFRSVYYDTSEVDSPLNLPEVVPNGTAGEITIIAGWANNNGCRISKTAYSFSGGRSVSERYNFQGNASGVSISLGTLSIDSDGDIDVTFSDNQGDKVQNVRVYIEYFIQQGETNIT